MYFQGYAAEMDNPAMQPLIPSALQNKKEVLFGNMPEIYEFHKRCLHFWIHTFPVLPKCTVLHGQVND